MPSRKVGSRVVVAPAALADIDDVLRWSRHNFGAAAAARYRALLNRALRDIDGDRERPAPDRSRNGFPVAAPSRSQSRSRVAGIRVKEPRHLLLYRVTATGTIDIARILHDSVDLPLHLPEDYSNL